MQYFTNPEIKNPEKKYSENYSNNIISTYGENFIENSYTPLTLTLEKNNIKYSEVEGIRTILKPVISKLFNTNIKQIEILDRKDYYVFNPITDMNISIFLNPDWSYKTIDLNEIIGYTLLSDSSLTRYIVENNDEYNFLDIKYYHGCALIKIEDSLKLLEIQGNIDMEIKNLVKKGYFTYSFGIFDIEDHEIIRELCLMYDIKIVNDKNFSTMVLQTETDFYTTPEEWLRYNLPLIRSGNYPSFTFKIFEYNEDYQMRYGTNFKDSIMKYVAYMAYAQLSDTNEIIKSSIFSIKINEDLSISVNLPTYSLVKEYKEKVRSLLKIRYIVENCKDFKDGIIKRWIVQSVDPDAYPLVFKDKTDTDILVHRSPLALEYPSPFDYSKKNMEKAEKELLEEMRNYYKKCHDNIEPVTLEKISDLNLDELLTLVSITENNVTYCFTNDTISKVDKNPLTRKNLSESTLNRVKYINYGLAGVFDVGVLYGLYSEFPEKINIKTEIGIPEVKRIRTSEKERQLVGNLFSVEVLFSDGTVTPLFNISLPTVDLENIDLLKNLVDKLWSSGFFLNNWYTAVNKYLKNIKSMPVLVTDTILLHASDSIFDGNVALNYLKENANF